MSHNRPLNEENPSEDKLPLEPQQLPSVPLFTTAQYHSYCEEHLSQKQCEGIDPLAERLKYLPLALWHAIAYMQQNNISAKDYLERYEKARTKLFEDTLETKSSESDSNEIVFTTCQVSIDSLEEIEAKAVEIVKLCAYLHSDPIPEAVLKKALGLEGDMTMNKCMQALEDYGLLLRDRAGVRMHQRVQESIRHHEEKTLSKEELFQKRLKPLSDALHKVYILEKATEDYSLAQKLQPHLEAVLNFLKPLAQPEDKGEDCPALCQATLLSTLGDLFLNVSEEAKEAIACHNKVLAITLKIYGEEHPYIAVSYNHLGDAYNVLGEAKKALVNHEKALNIQLKIYGEKHPDIATTYSILAGAYYTLGDMQAVSTYQEKALDILLKFYDEEHLDIAIAYASLGSTCTTLGQAEKALPYQKKALDILLKTYGEEHPHIAMIYGNLADTYKALGQKKEVLTYQKKLLAVRLKILDEEDLDVANSYCNLGDTYMALGAAQQAVTYQKKALAIKLKILGEKNFNIAAIYNNLGNAYHALGEAKEALFCYEKSLAIKLNTRGEEHPSVALSYENLGILYQDILKNNKEAKAHLEKALAIYKKLDRQQDIRDVLSRLEKFSESQPAPSGLATYPGTLLAHSAATKVEENKKATLSAESSCRIL